MPDFPIAAQSIYSQVGAVTASTTATLLTAGSANTKGSYAEITSATPAQADGIFVTIQRSSGTTAGHIDRLVDIALGGAGSEIVVIPNILFCSGTTYAETRLFVPIRIPAGTRIAARVQASTSSSTVYCMVHLVRGGLLYPVGAGVVSTYGANTADSGGTGIDPGSSADTKGAWTQITASCNATSFISIRVGNQTNSVRANYNYLLDIGIGAAASEIVVFPNILLLASGTADLMYPTTFPTIPMSIPAGTRIAARAQCDGTDATDRLFDVSIIGIG